MSRKLLSTILVLALALGACVMPITVFAEEAESTPAIDHSLDIELYTVPMDATVSILYAIKRSAVASTGDLKLVVVKGEETTEVDPAGLMEIGGVDYIIFEYTGLNADEMRTEVTACIRNGDSVGSSVNYSVAAFAEAYAAKGGQYTELVNDMLAYGDAVAKLTANK